MPQGSARDIALTALLRWRTTRQFADVILHDLLSTNRLPGSDSAFAVELFYGTLRNLTLLDFWIGRLRQGKLDLATRDLLRLGLYQLLLLRTPEHAALFETVRLGRPRQRPLINAVLRAAQRIQQKLQEEAINQPLPVCTSHPAFLIERWRRNFGQNATVELCDWNNQPAPVYARINHLRISTGEFLSAYPTAIAVPPYPDFVELRSPTDALERGLCYVQDPSTIHGCELLDPRPGERVLDACAAPGGKTGFMAQQMENRGSIVACDRDPRRLERLISNLQRLGIENTIVTQHDWNGDSDAASLTDFDRILLDAPCSNTGVMRRRVDVRWRLSTNDFVRMQKQQRKIAGSALRCLKPGGTFVYSTCSLEPEENEEVVLHLEREFPHLKLMEQQLTTPFRDGFDGAFAAKFIRRD